MRDPVRVWDWVQRTLHWGLAAAVAATWCVGEERLAVHIAAGYAAASIAAARVAWGWCGSRHARFASFVRGPRVVLGYARTLAQGRAPRYLGHNPLGGWMVVALLLCLAIACTSGILYTTDRFWGLGWLEQTHRISAWTLLALAGLHVGGVALMSWRHRDNLIGAMFTGRKQGRGSSE